MWHSSDKVLGVIGGMGPLASQLFYRMIIERTDAASDQEHVELILLNHTGMPDRTRSIQSGQTEEIYQLLRLDALWLQENQADALAIPCNTSHYFAERLQAELDIPLIHMINETARAVADQIESGSRVGILATEGTIGGELYQRACQAVGLTPVVPTEELQETLNYIIYDKIKAGRPVALADFAPVEEELRVQDCAAAILGCTELSVIRECFDLPVYYIDAMEVLADRCIEFCGKRVRK